MEKQKGLPARALLRQLQAGQILLIVVLVIIVASTIGLSLASRSITNLRSSTEEAESQKALAAAEAGIERSIQSNVSIAIPQDVQGSGGGKNSSYSTDVKETSGNKFLIYGGLSVEKDEGTDVWFVNHLSNGNLDYPSVVAANDINLYWGSSDEDCSLTNKPAAIQVIVVTRSSAGTINSYRYAYDSCSRGNSFTSATTENSPSIDGVTFRYHTPSGDLGNGIPLPKNIISMRVIPIYKNTKIGIIADVALPTQGYRIDSTGTSGQANRKIRVFKGWPQTYLPYLSYGLFVAK